MWLCFTVHSEGACVVCWQMEFYSVHVRGAGRWNSTVYRLAGIRMCISFTLSSQTPLLASMVKCRNTYRSCSQYKHLYGKTVCASVHILANIAHLKNDVRGYYSIVVKGCSLSLYSQVQTSLQSVFFLAFKDVDPWMQVHGCKSMDVDPWMQVHGCKSMDASPWM